LKAYESSLKAYKSSLKAYESSLKVYESSLKAYERLLKYYESPLKELISEMNVKINFLSSPSIKKGLGDVFFLKELCTRHPHLHLLIERENKKKSCFF
jgi:hypothetical protein